MTTSIIILIVLFVVLHAVWKEVSAVVDNHNEEMDMLEARYNAAIAHNLSRR